MQQSKIRKGIRADAQFIAALHMQEINQGFLSELGLKFLTMFYESTIESDAGFCIVVEEDSTIVGFVCGTTSLGSLYKVFLMRHTLQAIPLVLPKLLNVQRIKKVVETLLYPSKKEADLPEAELLSIAVSRTFHGKGSATQLFEAFIGEMRQRKITQVKVVVGESLERAIAFYEKMGFVFHSTIEVHKGKVSKVYTYNII